MSTQQSIRIVGGVLPPSLIGHLQDGTLGSAESRSAKSYHLVGSESVRDGAARAWSYLRGAWNAWREADHGRLEGSAGTGPARERWLLPLLRELGYGQVPPTAQGLSVDGVDYPVSHLWQHVPVHLLGPGVALDKRNPGVAGAARAPQAMVQELLNRTDEHLWAILSNGTHLRLLRDSTALVGSAYVEFDLEAIFEGELYAEWLVLFQLAHVSRVETHADQGPSSCWLETWRGEATDAGARALGRLEAGVERALGALGSGFLTHPANCWLFDALRNGGVSRHDYHRALLRLIYRLLFTFVAEDRDLLLDRSAPPKSRERYAAYFSTARLRRLSRVRAGGPHGDIWHAQRRVLEALGTNGLAELALPALGGIFAADPRAVLPPGAPDQQDLLWRAEIANSDLLAAVAQLAWIEMPGGRTQPIDYRHLGAEELGSVYEALLELDPTVDLDERTFAVVRVAGNERKTSGSYYTSPGLVSALLDTALDPIIARAAPLGVDPETGERALLGLTVCDPACGSGGFLVAAARRIAHRLAEIRAGDDSATPEMIQHAMRDVVGRCIYGVDLNDLAAELAKVSLWIEALEPGKPLSFLDARIRTGNALIGTTPALLERGVPDDAFKEIEGDDKKVASEIRKRNKAEASGQDLLFGGSVIDLAELAGERRELLTNVDTIDEVKQQRTRWEKIQKSDELHQHRLQADAWCAAFVWPLKAGMPLPPTSAVIRALSSPPNAYLDTVDTVEELARQYRFFHWHLEFPEVFLGTGENGSEGWSGGFSCMLGNPPWERVKLQEQEFFAALDPEISSAPTAAARTKLIKKLEYEDPTLFGSYLETKRFAEGHGWFMRASGRFPLNGRGDVNTYSVFAELFRSLTGPLGRSGVIAPTGIATDATTQYFFKDLVETRTLAALYDFENAKPLFAGVHRSFKFCLLTISGRLDPVQASTFAFFLHDPAEVAPSQFSLTPDEITLLNPNTGTCPVFRSRRDAEITLAIYRRVPILVREAEPPGNPWEVFYIRLIHAGDHRDYLSLDRNAFSNPLPIREAKSIHQFDHLFASFENGAFHETSASNRNDAGAYKPRYWVDGSLFESIMNRYPSQTWLLGYRDICRSTDVRTLIAAAIPRGPATVELPVLGGAHTDRALLLANLNAFVLDYVARQKNAGTHMAFYVLKQLPILPPSAYAELWPGANLRKLMIERVVELTYTDASMQAFGRQYGWGRPAVWDAGRRAQIRAELDAAFFHLYGVERGDVDYIMETFPIVKRKDMAEFGEYRTKRLVLEVYDAMQKAIDTQTEYQTILDPPPGEGARHPAKESAQ